MCFIAGLQGYQEEDRKRPDLWSMSTCTTEYQPVGYCVLFGMERKWNLSLVSLTWYRYEFSVQKQL